MPGLPERTAPPSPHGFISCPTHVQYGMGCTEFEALRSRAAEHCEACGTPTDELRTGRLVIDHDHRYGMSAVRGLICHSCNSTLGALERRQGASSDLAWCRFDEYLRRAWFLQVAQWGRFYSPRLNVPDEELNLVGIIMRFVKPLTVAAAQQPSINLAPVLTPGPTRQEVLVAHGLAEVSNAVIHTRLLCSKRRELRLHHVHYADQHGSVFFASPQKAAAHVRTVREKAIEKAVAAAAAREEPGQELQRIRLHRLGGAPGTRTP